MGKFSGWLLFSDLDETLLNHQKEISAENRKALDYFTQEGGMFSIATGRSEVISRKFTQILPINHPAIIYNGCGIYDFSHDCFIRTVTLCRSPMDQAVLQVLKRFPNICLEVFTQQGMYYANPNGKIDNNIVREGFPFDQKAYEKIEEPVFKALFQSEDNALLHMIRTFLQQVLPQDQYEMVTSSDEYLEILPAHSTKGDALQWLKDKGNYKKTVAIGDYENDLKMLLVADVSAAVANARPALLRAASIITVDNERHALYDLIFHYLDRGIFSHKTHENQIK